MTGRQHDEDQRLRPSGRNQRHHADLGDRRARIATDQRMR